MKSLITPASFKNRKTVQKRFNNFDFCFWLCPYGKQEVVFEGYVKINDGMKHLTNRYDEVSILDAADDVIQHGVFSPRPYQLGQCCDGSINECALALFCHFCRNEGHSPDLLYKKAYPDDDRKIPSWPKVIRFADWQGVSYPKKWNAKAKAELLKSLHEINFHLLAEVVFDLIENKPI